MPHERFKTSIRRDLAGSRLGRKNKRKKEIRGSTPSFPLTGDMPSIKAGVKVEASEIKDPIKK